MSYEHSHDRRGFTLIELSIVMVIIALVAAGILGGRAVQENAALQSVVADFDQYRQAALSYRDKYRELPGDHTSASAITSEDSASCTAPAASDKPFTATCNGNGDGIIGNGTGDPLAAFGSYHESLLAWQHLSNDRLIKGQYNGRRTTAANEITTGINAPQSKLTGASFILRFFPTNTVTTGYFNADYGHVFFFGKPGTAANLPFNVAALTSEQAKAIDLKIDDGKPGLGKVLTSPYSVTSTCVTNTASETAAEYDGTVSGIACSLIFITGF